MMRFALASPPFGETVEADANHFLSTDQHPTLSSAGSLGAFTPRHTAIRHLAKRISSLGGDSIGVATCVAMLVLVLFQTDATGQSATQDTNDSQASSEDSQDTDDDAEETEEKEQAPVIDVDELRVLDPEFKIWYDRTNKWVVMDGEVCLREGPLEVFACPVGTKEHESIIKVYTPAMFVHAALLRVGAIPGTPVMFDPMYRPADGAIIDIWVYWTDEEGESQSAKAQEWVRNSRTKEALDQDWVFGGSGFWVDEETGERFYQAEGGELICLSNFSTATMDLPIESSDSNAALLFEPFTERIPNRRTPVRLVLKPRVDEDDMPTDDDDSTDDDSGDDDGDDDDGDDDDGDDGDDDGGDDDGGDGGADE